MTERSRILASCPASERAILRRMGCIVTAPLPAVEWYVHDPEAAFVDQARKAKHRRQTALKRKQRTRWGRRKVAA